MKPKSVKTSGRLLLDPQISHCAKLVWMIHELCAQTGPAPVSPGLLEAKSGLAWHTVRRGLALLEATGWLPTRRLDDIGSLGWAMLPHELLLDQRIGIPAKLLYGDLQLTPGFRNSSGQFTYVTLAALSSLSVTTVKTAVRVLQAPGWLKASQSNKFAAIRFTLLDPAAKRCQSEVYAASRRLAKAKFKGEAIMQEYLSLIVASREYEENATPGFLINPFTGEEMQLDRYYPPGVAFEFNGSQHYGTTDHYPSEADARKQRGRDLLKKAICAERGITLVVVHPGDLTLANMRQMTEGLLPQRCLEGHEPLIAHLEARSDRYRENAPRSHAPAQPHRCAP
jgi:hypothetical protein